MPIRILLDECLPKKLKRELRDYSVATVQEMGWSGKKNGELMGLARDHFDIFLTADQNLQYQQNLAYASIGVVILVAPSNRIEALAPLMPKVNTAIASIKAGDIVSIEAKA